MAEVQQAAAQRIAVVALTALGSLLGHHGGDYLAQDDCMAAWKQNRDEDPKRACRELVLHAATYTVAQAATKVALYRTAGLRVPLVAQLAGAVVEGVLHAVIDDGRMLRRFSRVGRGRPRFRDDDGRPFGRQERFHDVVPGGRALMDQAVHHQVQIPAGAIATAVVAVLVGRPGRSVDARPHSGR
jgi:hypothetical protein